MSNFHAILRHIRARRNFSMINYEVWTYPIMRSSPALVLLFSITILKENVSMHGVCGTPLVVLGVYTINMQNIDFLEGIMPVI